MMVTAPVLAGYGDVPDSDRSHNDAAVAQSLGIFPLNTRRKPSQPPIAVLPPDPIDHRPFLVFPSWRERKNPARTDVQRLLLRLLLDTFRHYTALEHT